MKAIKVDYKNENYNYLEISLDDAIVWTENASFFNVDFLKIYKNEIKIEVKRNIIGKIRWKLANNLYLVEETGPVRNIKDIIREHFPELNKL